MGITGILTLNLTNTSSKLNDIMGMHGTEDRIEASIEQRERLTNRRS